MFYKTLTLLALLLLFTHAEVVVLDDSNYTSFIQQHPVVMVKFYAPWCGHCKSMAPDYIKLAEAAQGKDYVIAEVDATVAEKTASDVGVQGYPTIKLIVSGTPIDYDGARTTEAMQSWIENLLSSEIKQVTEDNLKQLIGTQNLVVIQGASKEQLRSLAFAQQIAQNPFYAVEGGSLKVTLYLQNSKTIEYTGEVSITELSQWVTQQTLGHLVALSSQGIVKQIFENEEQLPSFLLLKNPDFTSENFQTLRAYCEAHEKEIKCAYADQTHEIYRGIARFFKAEDNQHSLLAFFDYGIKNGYFVNNATQITQQSLAQFIADVNEGKVQKFHDEEKAQEERKIKYTNVVKLNNQTYQTTLQNNKFVFVEYYSSTCGHCVKFAPEYEELATKLKAENSEFLIAAVDLSEQTEINQIAKVSGYPTFRFYVNGQQLDYNGPRDGQSMINFMSKVSKSQLRTVNSIQDLQKPAIAVYGIDENSPFHLLQHIYTRFPVYQVLGDSEFKVEIHEKKFATYSGEKDLNAVANWLDENTQSIIVNVVEANPSKKLNKALEGQIPLLVIINRDNSAAFNAAYSFLQTYCPEKTDFICGIANKEDAEYESFNSWVNAGNDVSGIVYLNTEKFEKYIFPGDLATLNADVLNQFIADVKEGKIQAHQGEPDSDIVIDATNAEAEDATPESATETETQPETAVQNEDL